MVRKIVEPMNDLNSGINCFRIDNIYVCVDGSVCIPMGTDCAPVVAIIFFCLPMSMSL